MINLIFASKSSANLNVLRLLLPLYKRPAVICTALPQGTHGDYLVTICGACLCPVGSIWPFLASQGALLTRHPLFSTTPILHNNIQPKLFLWLHWSRALTQPISWPHVNLSDTTATSGGIVLFSIESAKFWPILALFFCEFMHFLVYQKKGQNNSKVYQNGQISGMTPIGTSSLR